MIAFKELLVRAKRGEEKAFEELFEQFAVCQRILPQKPSQPRRLLV